jgi:adenylate cyclase
VTFANLPWRAIFAGCLIGLAAALADAYDISGFLANNELKAVNEQFSLRGPRKPHAPVVVVTVDEDSFVELNMPWPWPRALHAKFIDIVSRGNPAVIALDVLFIEPSSRGPADDLAFATAIARSGKVVLAAGLGEVRDSGWIQKLEKIQVPLPELRAGAAAWGPVNIITDRDAFVRRGRLTVDFQDREYAGFDLQIYRLAKAAGIPAAPLPVQPEFWINYAGPPDAFPRIAYSRIVSGEIPPEVFKGQIVLVGATTQILQDVFPTPFAPFRTMPGVLIHANILDTLFSGIPIRRAPAWVDLGLAMVAGGAAAWAATALRPLGAFLLVSAAAVTYLAGTQAAFRWGRLWIDALPVPLALIVPYVGVVAKNFAQEQLEKRRLSRFFSPNVVKEIVRQKDDAGLGASRRRMTVLFSDIRGFTSMSEKMEPEEVVTFLREYLTEMTEAVFRHGGTVDKYIGDAIMALYNVPFEAADHPAQAVRTALEFQQRLEPLAERFAAKYGGSLRCGVGINTGDAVVGTIGSRQRLEYTAIGDTINLGSRLESITKDFNVPVIISEATWLEIKDLFETRYLGEVTVKGKEIPVKIYTVMETAEKGPSATHTQVQVGAPSAAGST